MNSPGRPGQGEVSGCPVVQAPCDLAVSVPEGTFLILCYLIKQNKQNKTCSQEGKIHLVDFREALCG